MVENETMKNKIQHLESSVYELQEAVKELLKPKPKPTPKRNLKIRIVILKIKISNNIMGSKQSTVENGCIQELNRINEEELDISRIDKLQIKALKEINSKIEKLNKEKSDSILYKLPVQICNYSLF